VALREEIQSQGAFLFRFRSYLPLIFFLTFIVALFNQLDHLAFRQQTKIWELFSLFISIIGLSIRIYTIGHVPKGTSGRNTKKQIAEVLNTTGVYSVIRHPLYFGNYFMWLGIALFVHSWWLILVFTLAYWMYYERIMYAEEEFLREKFGTVFIEWARQTPAFVPNFTKWHPSNLTFSWRHVLKREYHGFFAVIASFTILDIIGDYVIANKFRPDMFWIGMFAGSFLLYLIIRFLALKTRLLQVDGR